MKYSSETIVPFHTLYEIVFMFIVSEIYLYVLVVFALVKYYGRVIWTIGRNKLRWLDLLILLLFWMYLILTRYWHTTLIIHDRSFSYWSFNLLILLLNIIIDFGCSNGSHWRIFFFNLIYMMSISIINFKLRILTIWMVIVATINWILSLYFLKFNTCFHWFSTLNCTFKYFWLLFYLLIIYFIFYVTFIFSINNLCRLFTYLFILLYLYFHIRLFIK